MELSDDRTEKDNVYDCALCLISDMKKRLEYFLFWQKRRKKRRSRKRRRRDDERICVRKMTWWRFVYAFSDFC